MKLSIPFISLVLAVGVSQAAHAHSERGVAQVHGRHARIHQRQEIDSNLTRRTGTNKRCKPRPASSKAAVHSTTAEPAKETKTNVPSTTAGPTKETKAHPSPSVSSKPAKSSTPSKSSSNSGDTNSSSGGSGKHLLTVQYPQCGSNGAISNITPLAGPNGAEKFLNCGIDGAGWNPPPVQPGDLVTVDLSDAIKESGSPFHACAPFLSYFEQYGSQLNIPSILLASIAMQESSCNPSETGQAGEQGLMQITKDKCGSAPNGNCKDPAFNIKTGAEFFSSLISQYNGNVLEALGSYNGWFKGLTIREATAAATSSCCRCQNNLDYLSQVVNGWVLNRDPSDSPRIGQYFNLDQCSD